MLESKFQEQSLKQQQQHDAAVQKVKYIHFGVKIKVWNSGFDNVYQAFN